jgi:hypothetical protein
VPARRLDAPTAAASDTDDVGDWPRICNVTMRGIFSADLSGKVVKVKDKLFIIAGVADKLLVVSDDGGMEYPAEKVILAMVLGNIATVRSKLALKSKIVSGTLHGRQVTGRRFERQPHLGDVNRLVVWGEGGATVFRARRVSRRNSPSFRKPRTRTTTMGGPTSRPWSSSALSSSTGSSARWTTCEESRLKW